MKWPTAKEVSGMTWDEIGYWLEHDGSDRFQSNQCSCNNKGKHWNNCSNGTCPMTIEGLGDEPLRRLMLYALKSIGSNDFTSARDSVLGIYSHAMLARRAILLMQKIESNL